MFDEDSDNATGAANQQERLDSYIAGFVDGEGTFHVAIQRSPYTRVGWQLVPEFRVSQDIRRIKILDLIEERMACGSIRENHRHSDDNTMVFVVRRRVDLITKVIPFFEMNPLLSCKHEEFVTFADIVRRMALGEHLHYEGFERLAARALGMHGGGRYRPAPPQLGIQNPQRPYARHHRNEVVKIWSDLHGDMQSQAEMTWPPDVCPAVTNVSVPIRCSRRRPEEGCP